MGQYNPLMVNTIQSVNNSSNKNAWLGTARSEMNMNRTAQDANSRGVSPVPTPRDVILV
jgi:hypothetical protein